MTFGRETPLRETGDRDRAHRVILDDRADRTCASRSDDLSIRRATLDDLDELIAWRMEVLHEVFADDTAESAHTADAVAGRAPVDWEALRAANRAYYARAIADGSHIACFAQIGGESVACGSICLQEELPSPDNPSGRCAYLMNMYTRATYRGRGIASAVVDWVVCQARDAGAGKIYLETTPAGRGVYVRAGFVDLPDMMKLRS